MNIKLEASNGFELELESGLTFRLREDGSGRLAIKSTDDNMTKFACREGFDLTNINETNNEIIIF